MAVRSRLRELLQDPLLGGAVTVERPPCLAAATCALRPSSSSPPGKLGGPPPQEPPLEECAMFQCRGCWTVLGDSLHLCAQQRLLGILVCFKVTNNVTWASSLMIGLEGDLLGCAYNALTCRSCGLIVGFILYSASRHLACLRGFFCFFKNSILCYLLKKNIIIEASKVNFPIVTLKEQVYQLKKKVVKLHYRMELLVKNLEELTQKYNAAERRIFLSSDVADLPAGYAIVRIN